jgi:phosphatidylglycerophosphatase A
MSVRLIRLLASCFYLGYFPSIPGTVTSLAGLLVYLLIGQNQGLYVWVVLSILILGLFISRKAEAGFGQRDDSRIVIDELAGVLVAFTFIPLKLFYLIVGFVGYRILDVLKPPPVKWMESLKGGFGIMFDDLVAGLCTNLFLQVLVRFELWMTV